MAHPALKSRFFQGSTIQYPATDIRSVTILARAEFSPVGRVQLSTKRSDQNAPVLSHYTADEFSELFAKLPRGSELVALS